MRLIIENIPQELHHLKQWVCWKKIVNDKGKITKIPVNALTGKNAMSNNPDTWTDMMGAVVGCSQFNLDGIGFMFANGYFGIDLDDCSTELKNEFIENMRSYTEISQSGNGIHIIAKGTLPQGARRTKGIEMYDSERFFVMTGNVLGNYNIEDCTERVKPLYNKYLVKTKEKEVIVDQAVVEEVTKPVFLTDNDVLKKAQNSRNGTQFKLLFDGEWETLNYPSQSEADNALCKLLAFWTGKNPEQMDRLFRMSGLYRDKWDRKQSGTTYGAVTIDNAIKTTKNVYTVAHQDETNILVNAKTGEVAYKGKPNYGLNDTGNAERFVDRFKGFIRYNFENKMWMIWNGRYWQNDITSQIKTYAEVIINDMKVEAFQTDDEDERKVKLQNVQRAYSSKGKEAMLKEVMHADGIPAVNADFDSHPMLFNVENGIIDLTNGKLMNHDRQLAQSKISPHPVDFKNKPKLWLKFLDEIFLGDKDVIRFIQKAIGYTLTGSIKEQCLFICYGDGNNGKSVFLDILGRLMGEYGANASVETILERKSGATGASSDLARLRGARFVTTGENNEGTRLNEGLIKQLTGGEKITARFLYGVEFEFYPEFKLWLATNHKPVIRGTDFGIWRRLRAIPFEMKIPEEKVDKDLVFKLAEEIAQIKAWAVEGCLLWQKEGLDIPKAISKATEDYKNEMDVINMFLMDNCHTSEGWETSANEVYKVYEKWAKDSNEYVMSLTKFGRELAKRYPKERKSYGVVYMNLRLNKDNPTYVYNKFNV